MASVRSKNTKPELFVRQALHAAGLRFRLHRKNLPGKPDVVLPKFRMAVFVNGCYWHGHDCRYAKLPTTNRAFWADKISENFARDQRNLEALRNLGWNYHVIWSCDIKGGSESLIDKLKSK